MDLEAAEFFIRSSVLDLGARVLEKYLDLRLANESPPVCANKHVAQTMDKQSRRCKTLRTILGNVTLWRARFVCPVCGAVRYRADEILGVANTIFSPGARRMMARAGSSESFDRAAQDLFLYAQLRVDAKDVERVSESVGRVADDWMRVEASKAVAQGGAGNDAPPKTLYVLFDGTGAPMRKEELEGTKGKSAEGRARTREVKLGCVFTQTTVDEEGRPVRDEASTTYVGAIEESRDFGHRIHAEAVRRGLNQAGEVVVITDAQAYNKTIAAEHFPAATHIIDLYHAREHLAAFARDAAHIPLGSSWHRKARRHLDKGRIALLLAQLREALPRSGERRAQGLKEIGYFQTNAAMMRYGQFRKCGYFIGSGVIEAGCRMIVGKRLKNSGMFWSVKGANAILALRCCILSGRFEQFWEDKAVG